jgi:hypothetical protein
MTSHDGSGAYPRKDGTGRPTSISLRGWVAKAARSLCARAAGSRRDGERLTQRGDRTVALHIRGDRQESRQTYLRAHGREVTHPCGGARVPTRRDRPGRNQGCASLLTNRSPYGSRSTMPAVSPVWNPSLSNRGSRFGNAAVLSQPRSAGKAVCSNVGNTSVATGSGYGSTLILIRSTNSKGKGT